MSQREYKIIASQLKPFLTLLVVVAGTSFLASCGGGQTADQAAQGTDSKSSALALPRAGTTTDTATTTSGTVPGTWTGRVPLGFNPRKIEADQLGKPIEDVSSIITNQYIITPLSRSADIIYIRTQILNKNKIRILSYDQSFGFKVEIDDQDAVAIAQLEELRLTLIGCSIYHNSYTGKNINSLYDLPPNDGSPFNDGGDNWHLEVTKTNLAWVLDPSAIGLSSQIIGVMDGGIFKDHPDLVGRLTQVYSEQGKDRGHGTAVTGTIAANTDNNIGISGINWHASIAIDAIKDGEEINTIRAYQSLIDRNPGLKIVSNSWGRYYCTQDSVVDRCLIPPTGIGAYNRTRAYRNLALRNTSVLHVWATGNDGVSAHLQNGALHLDDSKVLKKLDNVIVVTAFLADGKLAAYGDYGDTVDLAAPTEFRAPRSTASGEDLYYGVNVGKNYGEAHSGGFNGTSAATPVVSGIASLVMAVNNDLNPEQVKNILIYTASQYVTERYYYNEADELRIESLATPIPIIDAEAAVREAIRLKSLVTSPDGIKYEIADCGNWTQCRDYANAKGGKLATIRSPAENAWIASTLLPKATSEWGFWIGFNDRLKDGFWTWDSGEPISYTNWSSSYNPNPNTEDVAHMVKMWGGTWNDDHSVVTQALIEYKPANAGDKIYINIQNFKSSSLNIAADSTIECRTGLVYNAPPYNDRPNLGEWDFYVPNDAAGLYKIQVFYSAEQSRPVTVSVDGVVVNNSALGGVNGTWCSSNFMIESVGEVRLASGVRTIKIERPSVFPHLARIVLTRTE